MLFCIFPSFKKGHPISVQFMTLADIKENLDCCICMSVMFLYSLLSFEAAEFESFIESPFDCSCFNFALLHRVRLALYSIFAINVCWNSLGGHRINGTFSDKMS